MALSGVDGAHRLLVPAPPDWPSFEISRRTGGGTVRQERLGADRAALRLRDGGDVVLERLSRTIAFTTPEPIGDEALVHPYLAPAAAIVAWWLGRLSFHAGAFVAEG